MSAAERNVTRILIGAGSFADAEAALRLVERIADRLAAEMGGILVEETIAQELASRPGQRLVTAGGLLVAVPPPDQMRTLIESEARAFREHLARLAEARAARWSFQRRRGDLIGDLWDAAPGWDLLLVGYRTPARHGGPVVLVSPAGHRDGEAQTLAEELAAGLGTDTLTVAPARHATDGDAEAALLDSIARMRASAVVLDLSAGPLRTPEQVRHLLEAARCPVIALGASKIAETPEQRPSGGRPTKADEPTEDS